MNTTNVNGVRESFQIELMIEEHEPGAEAEIVKAISELSLNDFDSVASEEFNGMLWVSGIVDSTSTSMREVIERIAGSVWGANGKWCRITIDILSIDHPPYQRFVLEKEDYMNDYVRGN